MKKFLAIVIIAAGMTACGDSNSSTSDETNRDTTSIAPAANSGSDSSSLRTDTSGPKPDSGMSR